MNIPLINPFELLQTAAEEVPHKLAISSPDGELTYAELFESSVRLAHVLRDRGVAPGQLVAIRTPALIDVALSQALFHEAAVGAHLPVGFEPELSHRFDWVLTTELLDGVEAQKQILVDGGFFEESTHVSSMASPREYESPDSLCRVSFSSGTTGIPKAIGWSIDCLFDRAVDRMTQWMPASPYLCMLGLSTGLAFMSCIAAFHMKETFLLPATGEGIANQIEKMEVKAIMGSPKQLSELLSVAIKHKPSFTAVNHVMSAGSALSDFLAEQLAHACDAVVTSTYASSEAGSIAMRTGTGTSEGYAGRVFSEVEVRIIDEKGNELEQGEIGLIGVRRARQPQDYLFTIQEADESFKEGFFYSGDTGYVIDRDLFLFGRVTEIINASGTKIDPARYESVILGYPGIVEAAVFGLEDTRGVETIGLVFVSETPLDVSQLRMWLREKFGDALPASIARVSHLERSPMGKFNRERLREQFGGILQQRPSLY